MVSFLAHPDRVYYIYENYKTRTLNNAQLVGQIIYVYSHEFQRPQSV